MSHGTVRAYQQGGCRCPACREAATRIRRRDRRLAIESGVPEHVEHGASAHANWGCRCEVCVEAHKAKHKTDRVKRLAYVAEHGIPPQVVHGSISAYNNWGCRCRRCRAGARWYYKKRRGGKKT